MLELAFYIFCFHAVTMSMLPKVGLVICRRFNYIGFYGFVLCFAFPLSTSISCAPNNCETKMIFKAV